MARNSAATNTLTTGKRCGCHVDHCCPGRLRHHSEKIYTWMGRGAFEALHGANLCSNGPRFNGRCNVEARIAPATFCQSIKARTGGAMHERARAQLIAAYLRWFHFFVRRLVAAFAPDLSIRKSSLLFPLLTASMANFCIQRLGFSCTSVCCPAKLFVLSLANALSGAA